MMKRVPSCFLVCVPGAPLPGAAPSSGPATTAFLHTINYTRWDTVTSSALLACIPSFDSLAVVGGNRKRGGVGGVSLRI